MGVIDDVLTDFVQSNTIVKNGQELLMSGELELPNLDAAAVSITCYIGKSKREFKQESVGNINTLQAYVMARIDVSPTIEAHDLLINERGQKFIVGPVTLRNENTTVGGTLNDAAYLYAPLELYQD